MEGARKMGIEEQRGEFGRGVDIGPTVERGGDEVTPVRTVSRRPEVVPREPFTKATERAEHDPLVRVEDATAFGSRWDAIQASFVDDPRSAVERADQLVDEVLRSIAQGFSQQKQRLHAALENDDPNAARDATEEMRQTFQRYRAFFRRALTVGS